MLLTQQVNDSCSRCFAMTKEAALKCLTTARANSRTDIERQQI
jgi:hypothetical protein